jgi:hypothetical protein
MEGGTSRWGLNNRCRGQWESINVGQHGISGLACSRPKEARPLKMSTVDSADKQMAHNQANNGTKVRRIRISASQNMSTACNLHK